MTAITRDTPFEELPELVTVAELATLWDCGTGLVYSMLERREIEHVRLGRLVRIPKREVLKFIAEQSRPRIARSRS